VCGRYRLTTKAEELALRYHARVAEACEAPVSWNITPGQEVLTLRFNPDRSERSLDALRWGLIPHWAKDPKVGHRLVNARAETVDKTPSYRQAFAKRRCLIPADGFYEWQKPGDGKGPRLPWYFAPRVGSLLALGGLWERWRHPDGAWLLTCTIVTTRANELMAPVHDRMPVIVAEEDFATWLERRPLDREEAGYLLAPAPEKILVGRRVSNAVSNVRNEGPELLAAP
jgi:putative SOS response-associated peptidase YedK